MKTNSSQQILECLYLFEVIKKLAHKDKLIKKINRELNLKKIVDWDLQARNNGVIRLLEYAICASVYYRAIVSGNWAHLYPLYYSEVANYLFLLKKALLEFQINHNISELSQWQMEFIIDGVIKEQLETIFINKGFDKSQQYYFINLTTQLFFVSGYQNALEELDFGTEWLNEHKVEVINGPKLISEFYQSFWAHKAEQASEQQIFSDERINYRLRKMPVFATEVLLSILLV